MSKTKTRVGRPPSEAGARRQHSIKLYDDEAAALRGASPGGKLATWLRDVGLALANDPPKHIRRWFEKRGLL